MSKRCNEDNIDDLMKFVLDAPFDDEIIAMDCRDACEQLSQLAEQAAAGVDVSKVLPALEEHMAYWSDCREEFDALVAIIKAEEAGTLTETDEPEQG